MTNKETKKLILGLYIIYWKSGGKSLAAVGSMANGDRWLAPCNWIIITTLRAWKLVKSVTLIAGAGETVDWELRSGRER